MSTDHSEHDAAPVAGRRRYGELTIDSGECIIYDRENHRAWIQSTVSLPVAALD